MWRPALFPLVRVKTCRVLTWQGWLVFLALLAGGVWVLSDRLYPYLAKTDPLGAEILVVEGWLPDEGLRQAWRRFEAGGYRRMLVTGGPLLKGDHLARYRTYAALGVASLAEMGLDPALMVAIPGPPVLRDRTYASALAARDWLAANGYGGTPVDIVTEGPHARRTWDLYRIALGPDWPCGIIAVPPWEYDPGRWWDSSAGWRAVTGEAIAWLYTRIGFRPRPPTGLGPEFGPDGLSPALGPAGPMALPGGEEVRHHVREP